MPADSRTPLYESAGFWVLASAAPLVAGLAVIDHAHVADLVSPWTSRAFQVGFGLLVAAGCMFFWGLILFMAHRHAEKHISAWNASHPVAPSPEQQRPQVPTGPTGATTTAEP